MVKEVQSSFSHSLLSFNGALLIVSLWLSALNHTSLCLFLRCICMDGYEGNGFSCQPIDLCKKSGQGGCSENVSGTEKGTCLLIKVGLPKLGRRIPRSLGKLFDLLLSQYPIFIRRLITPYLTIVKGRRVN